MKQLTFLLKMPGACTTTWHDPTENFSMVHSPHLQEHMHFNPCICAYANQTAYAEKCMCSTSGLVMVALQPKLSTSQKLHCPTTHISLICAEKMHVHIICNIYIFIGLNATTIEEQGDISLQGWRYCSPTARTFH